MAAYRIRSATFCSLFGFALFVMYPPVGWLPFGVGAWMMVRAIIHHRKVAAARRQAIERVDAVWAQAYDRTPPQYPVQHPVLPPYQYLDHPTWQEIYDNTAICARRKAGLEDVDS